LNNIINNNENITRAANEVNDEQIYIDVNYPQITLPLALQIRNLYGNLSSPIHMLTNSCIYVPIIRAAQNLTCENTDCDQIEPVRNFIGIQNFTNITLRLQEIFISLNVNAQNTGYNAQGYLQANTQILLLDLEERIINARQNNNITPLRQLLDTIIQLQLIRVKDTLIENHIPLHM